MSTPPTVSGPPLGVPPGGRPRSVPELIRRSVLEFPDHEAMRWKVSRNGAASGSSAGRLAGTWASWTYTQLWDQVRAVSLGFGRLGLQAGDRVVILGRSRPEWVVADLASLAHAAVTCPIQPGEPPARLKELILHMAPRLVIVENDHLLQRLRRAMDGSPIGAPIISFDATTVRTDGVRTMVEVAASAAASADAAAAWDAMVGAIEPTRVATIGHTMAEDGQLRGAVLTHGNVVHSALASTEAVPVSVGDVILSVLPLSHMFARGSGVLAPLGAGATVVFADHSLARWASDMAAVRPTVMCVIPFFLQQLQRQIRGQIDARPAWARRLVRLATGVAARCDELRMLDRPLPLGRRLQLALVRRMLLAPIHRALGGRLRFFVSGGAPLPAEIGSFFATIGIPVLEGFGLTETAPLLTVNRLGSHRYGSVGPPVVETEIRIDAATDEILVRGPQVMLGYLDLPEVNRRLIEPDGWFHTGDRGSLDSDGSLRITGRIKNLIVLSTGKKVAPGPIERALEASPHIGQAVLLGEGRAEVGVLLAPASPTADLPRSTELARLAREIEQLASEFAVHERPRRIGLLGRALSADLGELAEDGSPRRDIVAAHFPEEVAALFRGSMDQPAESGGIIRTSSSHPSHL